MFDSTQHSPRRTTDNTAQKAPAHMHKSTPRNAEYTAIDNTFFMKYISKLPRGYGGVRTVHVAIIHGEMARPVARAQISTALLAPVGAEEPDGKRARWVIQPSAAKRMRTEPQGAGTSKQEPDKTHGGRGVFRQAGDPCARIPLIQPRGYYVCVYPALLITTGTSTLDWTLYGMHARSSQTLTSKV